MTVKCYWCWRDATSKLLLFTADRGEDGITRRLEHRHTMLVCDVCIAVEQQRASNEGLRTALIRLPAETEG